jgi:MbtH protein
MGHGQPPRHSEEQKIMTNPFEDADAAYLVLVNDEGQHSLWPTFVTVPAGWRVALEAANRQQALDYVEQHWVDLRPRSLVEAADAAPTR